MKIIQIVTNLAVGDAVGADVLAIHRALTDAGYSCGIMALTIHERLADAASPVDFSAIAPEDLVILHKATGDSFSGPMAALRCRKVVLYHNITPADYFLPYDPVMAWNLWRGRRQLKKLAGCVDWGWADSRYNCEELRQAGFPGDRLAVLPILFDTVERERPDEKTLRALDAHRGTKLLFVGRVAPNKKLEDIVKVYYCFLREVDPDARLYLVGNWNGFEKYFAKVKGFAADLGLSEDQVCFTGHVTEAEKEAYLARADAFVCMSEHEGFGVPFVECMQRGLPVAAFSAAAVPETLGDNGLLFDRKDYPEMARRIGRVCRDGDFRAGVLERQREQLARFSGDETRQTLLSLVRRAIEDGGDRP